MAEDAKLSYLALSAAPELSHAVLSPMPVIVFDTRLQSILWSNAAGAHLFGGQGIADLLQMSIPENNPLILQLQHAVNSMGRQERVTRGFRFARGMNAQMLQFEIAKIQIPTRGSALRVSHLIEDDHDPDMEKRVAVSMGNALSGMADAAAVLDESGAPIGQSDNYAGYVLDPAEFDDTGAQVREQALHTADGETLMASFVRIATEPQRYLVLISKATGTANHSGVAHIHPDTETGEAVPPNQSGMPDSVSPEAPAETGSQEEQTDTRIGEATDHTPEAPEGDSPAKLEVGIADRSPMAPDPFDTSDAPEPVDPGQENSPVISSKEKPTRFAWSTNTDMRFISVSSDLEICVGQKFSDIEGKTWVEIAGAFDLDASGEIAELLDKRDTWSGKTVLWPCGQDGRERIEIELAALPSFNSDREFTGFRGYGKFHAISSQGFKPVVKVAEIRDPQDEDGSLREQDDRIREKPEHEPDSGADPDVSVLIDLPDAEEASSQGKQPDNIVQFSPAGKPVRELTEDEAKAFREVRSHLSASDATPIDESGILDKHAPTDTSLLERLPVAVLVYSDQEFFYANRHFLRLSGYDSLQNLKREGLLSDLLSGISDGEENQRTSLRKRDGQSVTINPVIHTVPWQGQKAVLLSFPVPAPARASDANDPENRIAEIQGILDTTSDGIVMLDQQGKVVSFNSAAEALFGTDSDEAAGKQLHELFAAESHDTIQGYLHNAAENGLGRLINEGEEVIAQEAGGGLIPVFVTITPMEESGKLCAVLRDITNWKRAEEELIQSRQQAERSSEQKSEFLAQVSHEIRTPLNAIIGFSDVMIEERFGPIENERYREYLLDIKRSGTHVLDIVNGLLDLSRIEAGKLELSFEAVDLNELVAETVALLQPQANANRTIIRTSLSRSVPKVVADPRSIRQIILNLVSNAIKYSDSNGQVIVSTVYDTNGEVALRVRDTGKGMTEEQIRKAMEPFQQAHSVKDTQVAGHGLGLPLTKALVEANRAFFELESEPGEGTIAHVQFPTQRVLTD